MADVYTRAGWAQGASGWVRHEQAFDHLFAPITAAVLDAAGLRPGLRALDVGCGSGTLIEAGVAAGAELVGLDIATDMVDAARQRVPAATIVLGDAQTVDLAAAAPGPPFDRLVSRFGVMFFEDPARAFANLRASSADDARVVFAAWQGVPENPFFTHGTTVLLDRLDSPPPLPTPRRPGPVAFADGDYLAGLLSDAGWQDTRIEPLHVTFDFGVDGSDGVEERLEIILATTTGRLARERLTQILAPAEWDALLDEVRAELRRHLVDGSVRFPGAVWIATARNAG